MNSKAQALDQIDDIAKYYAANTEDRRFQIQQLEFHVTWRLLLKYLKPKAKVLELGAGSGSYTLELARMGFDVTAVELVPSLTEISRQKLQAHGLSANLITADARELRNLKLDKSYDAVLVMGPLYHLVVAPERNAVVKDAADRLNEGGLLVTAHLSRVGLMGYMLARFPAWGLEAPEQVRMIMDKGYLPDHPRNGEFRGYFTTPDEIRELHKRQGLRVLKVHSQDPCIGPIDEVFNNLPDDIKNAWADILTEMSHDPMALGSGRSLLCVSRK